MYPLCGPFEKYAFNVSTCNSIRSDVSYAFKGTSSNVHHNAMSEKRIQMHLSSRDDLTLFSKLREP